MKTPEIKSCTCPDQQLANVGCECEAEQPVPASCRICHMWLRTALDLSAGVHLYCYQQQTNQLAE